MKNYTIETRVHCTLKEANKLADLVSDFADNAIENIDADVVLVETDTQKEIV